MRMSFVKTIETIYLHNRLLISGMDCSRYNAGMLQVQCTRYIVHTMYLQPAYRGAGYIVRVSCHGLVHMEYILNRFMFSVSVIVCVSINLSLEGCKLYVTRRHCESIFLDP